MRNCIWAIPALLLGMQAAAPAATITPGTEIAVRSDQPIEVARWDRGRIYPAHVARDVFDRDGRVAIPAGSPAELIVRQTGPGQFTLDLESITAMGNRYVVDVNGPGYNLPQDQYQQGNGVLGNILGAIAQANGQQVVTRGAEIHVPPGTTIRFNLQQPLHVANWSEPGYQQGEYHYHHEHDWYR